MAKTDGAKVLDVEITLPWPPHSLSANGRAHWAVKRRARREYEDTVFLALREQMLCPEVPCEYISLEYTFCYCGTAPDGDNAIAWTKAVQDAIRDFGLVVDDNPRHVNVRAPKYERVDHRDQRALKVRITSIGAG